MQAPLPRQCRLSLPTARLNNRNPRKLWKRACMKCKRFPDNLCSDRPEIVYCEECYLKGSVLTKRLSLAKGRGRVRVLRGAILLRIANASAQTLGCKTSFEISDDDLGILRPRLSPVFAGKKYPIPPPTLCPDCRQQRGSRKHEQNCHARRVWTVVKNARLTQYPAESTALLLPRLLAQRQKSGRDVVWTRCRFFPPVLDNWRNSAFRPRSRRTWQGELETPSTFTFAGSSKNCYLIMHADFCRRLYVWLRIQVQPLMHRRILQSTLRTVL